jgi:tRNA threonylcarbamoyladenosine biosynthesis protein TsaE
MKVDIVLPTESVSQKVAQSIARALEAPLVITFSGEIGAGKTTLIRAMLRALGVTTAIKSPTFSLIESYSLESFQVHHFDLYRIHDETELEYMGFRDYFISDAVCCIEWPERAPKASIQIDLAFHLVIKDAGRAMQAQAYTVAGRKVLESITGG